jgi:hypothetical protein
MPYPHLIQTLCLILMVSLFWVVMPQAQAEETWECEVFPSEEEVVRDVTSGARLTFVTKAPEDDTNLYFHQSSWLPDGSLLVFHSKRSGSDCYWGYLQSTGELVRLHQPGLKLGYEGTCSRFRNSYYAIVDKAVHEWQIQIIQEKPTRVTVIDRMVGPLPEDASTTVGLTENSDGSGLSIGFNSTGPLASRIVLMDVQTGECTELTALDDGISHIQSSWVTPDLVMFCRASRKTDRPTQVAVNGVLARMWLADASEREPWSLYPQQEGELVTHECWWVEDQVSFCAGLQKNGFAEEAHVKVIDIHTGIARIIGAGSWWKTGSPEEVSKYNWWHCAGAPTGKFVMADNWHGDIGIFSAKTSRTRLLTQNHRTYGKGAHPHAGWDPTGTKVVFASNQRGNPDVVIGILPEKWLAEEW